MSACMLVNSRDAESRHWHSLHRLPYVMLWSDCHRMSASQPVWLRRQISAKVAFEVMYAAANEGLLKNPKAVAAMSRSNEDLMEYIESQMWLPGAPCASCHAVQRISMMQ